MRMTFKNAIRTPMKRRRKGKGAKMGKETFLGTKLEIKIDVSDVPFLQVLLNFVCGVVVVVIIVSVIVAVIVFVILLS